MTLRQSLKFWFYNSFPGFSRSFPYYGSRVYFPKDSLLFRYLCEQGVYENQNVDMLTHLAKPGEWFFDVGTNLGFMSVPVLAMSPECRVLSFEPSPGALPFLQRTMAGSPHAARWRLVTKAAGAAVGRTTFTVSSPASSPYDGIRKAQPLSGERQVEVALTTIDTEWKLLGSPPVSVIKLDVEGAELDALRGAAECLQTQRPAVLLEWNLGNLQAFRCTAFELLKFARELEAELFALPHLVEIRTDRELELQMMRTESFLLSPPKLSKGARTDS
jgi:FkbM family methyltransferase